MSFSAVIFHVMIASPSDLLEERQAAREVIHEWNDLHAEAEGIVLLPLMWETHATPGIGGAQASINAQLVDRADLLIGLFWTKFGTNTGAAASGTVEEIDRIVAAGKPAMLYFSTRHIDPNKIDLKQMKRLKIFKAETYTKALTGTFASMDEFRQTLMRDLTRRVRLMKPQAVPSGTPVTTTDDLTVTVNSVRIAEKGSEHIRVLTVDVINNGVQLNDLNVTFEAIDDDGQPHEMPMAVLGQLPNPFQTGFTCQFQLLNDDPSKTLPLLDRIPPGRAAIVVYSNVREVARASATQWQDKLNFFATADPSLPPKPPPRPTRPLRTGYIDPAKWIRPKWLDDR